MEEERQLKLQQLSEARERKKREAEEYDLRLVQLAESDGFFQSKYALTTQILCLLISSECGKVEGLFTL